MHALQPNSFGLCQPPSADDSFGNNLLSPVETWLPQPGSRRQHTFGTLGVPREHAHLPLPSTRAISITGARRRKSRRLARFYPLTHALDLFDLNQERARRTGTDERFRQCAKGRISSPNNCAGLVPLRDVFSGTVAHSHNVGGYPPSKPGSFFPNKPNKRRKLTSRAAKKAA